MKIGMLTIGQSPRDDIIPGLIETLGDEHEIVEIGALDDFTAEDIDSIDLQPDDYVLVSRMRDEQEVKIPKRFINSLIQEKLKVLEKKGIKLAVLMCTSKFPNFEYDGLIVTPQEIIKGVLYATLKKGRLGVICPAEEQTHKAKSDFGRAEIEIFTDYLSPYKEEGSLNSLSTRLAKLKLDIVLLNCFGFASEVKKTIVEKTRIPVIQPNTLVARVLKELAT